MPTPALAIFTGHTLDDVLKDGGSRAWTIKAKNAERMRYAALYFNTKAPWAPEGWRPHGELFVVGRISGIQPDAESADRVIVLFDEYAIPESLPKPWAGHRFPVNYTTLEDLGIDLDDLDFVPMPGTRPADDPEETEEDVVARARRLVAAAKGVAPSHVEILIRL